MLGVIGKYEVKGFLGQGGFGRVYQAIHRPTGNTVALKELVGAGSRDVERCRREVEILQRLQHEGLPRVHELFQASGRWFLVMEYIPGESLQSLINRRGPLSWQQIRPLVGRMLDILEYLHANGIIHRDIKPANIIIRDKRPVLVDFGLAKETREQTMTAARGFTPAYSPPEQWHGKTTDGRADLYALGAMLFVLLTNRLPPDAIDRLNHDRLNTSTLPAGVREMVGKAMAVRPGDRFQDVANFRRAVLELDRLVTTRKATQQLTTVADGSLAFSRASIPAQSRRPVQRYNFRTLLPPIPYIGDNGTMWLPGVVLFIAVMFLSALTLQDWFGYEAAVELANGGTAVVDTALALRGALLFGALTLGAVALMILSALARAWSLAITMALPVVYLGMITAGLITSAMGVTAL